MEVKPIDADRDRLAKQGWTVCLVPSDPNGRFRIVAADGQPRHEPPCEGTELRLRGVPYYVSARLPGETDSELLDECLEPVQDLPDVRSAGRYMLRLMFEGGGSIDVMSGGYVQEFVPENVQ
ncbi:MAG TPA: hypothetical protein VMB52_02615 [Verrucomicrobiae bacterium]|nr:hypothetical protein [Verrucomicrobiae bacterium]